ncbi:hypothetical protein HII12_004310 [Brettanomyces bruxellensis]|uniref:DEBR0S4_01706g1_1 n=1 Tax=Dekkera bruxellensis TaxID=5007 RepID=A0A7D9H0P8_DEKBR|nr:hypothetical protein HII12_004310 [Brettanomyces bruxellensis]VUG18762.1 DEBR0S4_01706g1_1 [Brettanomyces bruxellensis]
MAPALPVYSREEIKEMYPELFPARIVKEPDGKFELDSKSCKLYTLVQNQCTFDGNQCICVPFRRLFARCLDRNYNSRREMIGYKLMPVHQRQAIERVSGRKAGGPVYRNVEITEFEDNDYTKYLREKKDDKWMSSELLEDFLRTDKIFQKKVHEYYEKMDNGKDD